MEQINYRFLSYKTYNKFREDLAEGKIRNDSIAFVKDKLCIWAHGKEYVCDGPYSADIANNTLTFSNCNNHIAFTILLADGTITITDTEGNTSSATYVLKNEHNISLSALRDNLINRDRELQRLIDTKASKTSVDDINDWKASFVSYITNIVDNQPFKDELRTVAYTGSYNDLIDKPTIPSVDSELDSVSTNPVQNRAVKEALDSKANRVDLSSYVLNSVYNEALRNKQDVLTPGPGIAINQNVISSTLDTSVYIIVTDLEEIVDPNPNKIYLLEIQNANGTYRYEQYRLKNGQWVSIDTVTPEIDLRSYLTKTDAALTYQPIGTYLTSADLTPYAKLTDLTTIRQTFNNYAPASYVDNNFQRKGDYATNTYVNDTFVRKTDVYNPKLGDWGTDDSSGNGLTSVIINPGSNITVDSQIDLSSSNPVENRIIARALNLKADALDLLNYALTSDLNSKLDQSALNNYFTKAEVLQGLSTKQDTLSPGEGISIVNNVISSTIDTNMWVIVDELPSTNINDNKIYLVETEENGETIYIEWRHKNGEWTRSGLRMPEIDLSGYQRVGDYAINSQVANTYLTKTDAASIYQPVGNYADVNDVDSTYLKKGDYVEYDVLEAFRINVDNTFLKRGAYALAADVTTALNTLQQIIDLKYVLKKDVYIPEETEFSTTQPTQITIGSINGDGTGSSQPGTSTASNMITLTTAQYEALVKANMVNENTYYFTYEETTWGFGDVFPVILTEDNTQDNIGVFPIVLTDGSTSDNIGTFPINLT